MDTETQTTTSAGGLVLNSKGEVLVVSQHNSSWSLPKGHVEEGEDTLDAAKREIYEESGVKDLTLIKPLEIYQRYKIALGGGEDKTQLKIMKMFLFTTKTMDLKPIDPHNPEARWVNKENVADLLTHPKDKEFFLRVKGEL